MADKVCIRIFTAIMLSQSPCYMVCKPEVNIAS